MEYKFHRTRIDKLSREEMVRELERAAKEFSYTEFGWRDFNKIASISANPIKKEFGSWKKALSVLKDHLIRKGLNLSPRKEPPNRIHSDKDMFDLMEEIWNKLGHRPSRTEWEIMKPKIHYNTYKQRFGGWQNACLKFIEYKMGENIKINEYQERIKSVDNIMPERSKLLYKTGDSRSIPLSMRMKVLSRDNFRCILCGRSPATDLGIKLHIDHRIPFAKGGKSTLDNLQTLCEDCNLGKSDNLYTTDG